jgi:hypothetical protein
MVITHGYGEKTATGDVIDYSHYNRFSLEYICRFLRIYQQWKAKRKMEQPSLPQAPQKSLPISETASKKTRRQIAELTYKDVCEKGTFILINVEGVFDEMQAAGLADDWLQLKNMYISQIQQPKKNSEQEKQERKAGLIGRLIMDLPMLDATGDELKQAKKLYIKDRFLYWKGQKRERVFE